MKNVLITNKENSIRKSNELSTAKLFSGLTLNQMQLFAYAIYVTQRNGESTFQKIDFEKKFKIEKYQTKQAKNDTEHLMALFIELKVEDSDSFKFRSIFNSIDYEKGTFNFEWSEYMKPHILELKNKFIETDLTVTINFQSSFSWTLYDILKASYGKRYIEIDKESLMLQFNVEKVKSYQNNTNVFKRNVLDVAISEINKYTEFNVRYDDLKKGRAIKGFKIHFHRGETEHAITSKQLKYLKDLEEITQNDVVLELIKIDDAMQRGLASAVVESILNICNKTSQELTMIEADLMIKDINEKMSYVRYIINTENEKQRTKIPDPYADIKIPIYDFY